ncbi:copper chaperone PCu(A)C [Nocardiopsis trehalosi]|uniref:copper chaperone PCu(A)C n=1 Tax=Nocardiopsis trehalosi TaxID=109329 RepID=UPI00082F4E49|nr:copper chaperone PCu(A)C [Nocardiopsis trehalosi]
MADLKHTSTAAVSLAFAACLAVTGCAGPEAPEQDGGAEAAAADAAQADSFTIEDAWIKAVTEDEGMTGVFGALGNDGDQDVTVVAATSSVAGMVELHEVVTGDDGNSVMREKDGGFTIPAQGTHALEPGADHIMLMDLGQDLEPGAEATVELEFADGSTTEFTAPVKDFEGANENYDEGAGHSADHGEEGH